VKESDVSGGRVRRKSPFVETGNVQAAPLPKTRGESRLDPSRDMNDISTSGAQIKFSTSESKQPKKALSKTSSMPLKESLAPHSTSGDLPIRKEKTKEVEPSKQKEVPCAEAARTRQVPSVLDSGMMGGICFSKTRRPKKAVRGKNHYLSCLATLPCASRASQGKECIAPGVKVRDSRSGDTGHDNGNKVARRRVGKHQWVPALDTHVTEVGWEEMLCGKCGTTYHGDASFCWSCGVKLEW
jgi:hypothetical protein